MNHPMPTEKYALIFWLGLAVLGVTAAFEVFRWRQTIRLFGRIPGWVPRRMLQYARAGRIGWLVNLATLMLALSALSPALWLIGAQSLAPLAPLGVAWAVIIFSRCSQPPAVLLLTSSSPRTVDLLNRINSAIFPLRVVALVDSRRMNGLSPLSWMDNLRTRNSTVWKGIVNSLIDLSPVVVVDTQGETGAVAHETSLMLERNRVRKAVFLTDGSGRYPALSANGIDPYEHALPLLDSTELIGRLRHYAHGRDYLPWPVEFPERPPDRAIVPEDLNTLPSVLFIGHADGFDSAWLIQTALASDKELLQVATPWTRVPATGADYVLNLTWEFLHDPRLAAISVSTMELFLVRIDFLRQFGAELPSVSARGHRGPLTDESLDQPDPVHAAVWKWAAVVERVADANGWRTREVTPPPGDEEIPPYPTG
jgi:hypothetical protein